MTLSNLAKNILVGTGIIFGILIFLPIPVSALAKGVDVTITPATREINPGDGTAYVVEFEPVGGLNGVVTDSFVDCPSYAVCSINIPSELGETKTEALTVTTGGSIALGDHVITIGITVLDGGQLYEDSGVAVLTVDSAPGSITRYYWDSIYTDTGGIWKLYKNPKYPASPDSVTYPTIFEAPTNISETYGTRIAGYIHPPQTGNYTFWIASDDFSELFLSTNDDPFYKRMIAYVDGWTSSRQWDKYASQKSAQIYLEAGKRYFIEATHVEQSGGDNLAVGWQLPDGTLNRPISGGYLSLHDGNNGCAFEPQEGRIIVPLQGTSYHPLVASEGEAKSHFDVSASIPAGNYKVSLASWDNHAIPQETQPQEQYFLKLLNSVGVLVVQSNVIDDLPDDQIFLIQEVNNDLSIAQQVVTVSAVHAAYPFSSTQSVHASCAAFDSIEESLPEPPEPPTSLNVVGVDNQVFLEWVDNADNEDGFKVYRNKPGLAGSLNLANYDQIGISDSVSETGGTGTYGPDIPPVLGELYSYAVSAFNSAGDSAAVFSAVIFYDEDGIVTIPLPLVSDVSVTEPNYCYSGPAITVGWTYSDPEGHLQSAYQAQVGDSGSAWNPPYAIDSGKVLSSGASYFVSGGLQFNTTYKARVRVWNSEDVVSDWVEQSICSGPGCIGTGAQWKTPQYAYPLVDFTWEPVDPGIDQTVQFTDQTTFYDGQGDSSHSWTWNFGDSGTSTQKNPSHAYVNNGVYNVNHAAADKASQTCSLSKPISVPGPIPIWKEVSRAN